MKKDFDKLSVKQLKHIHSIFHQQQLSNDEVSELIKSHNEIFESLSKVPPWSHLYELPYRTFLAVCVVAFDLADAINSIAEAPNKTQAFIDYIDNMPDLLNTDESFSEEDKGFRISLVMAINCQISSIAIHGQSLSQLVSQAKNGDDNALFDAVLVDRSIVSAPSIAHRIQVAQLNEDESFMDELSKAIKKSRPCKRRPEKDYDDLRYMLTVLEEEIGLKNIKNKNLLKLMEEDLQIYPKGTDTGSLRAFEQFMKRLNDKYRT